MVIVVLFVTHWMTSVFFQSFFQQDRKSVV